MRPPLDVPFLDVLSSLKVHHATHPWRPPPTTAVLEQIGRLHDSLYAQLVRKHVPRPSWQQQCDALMAVAKVSSPGPLTQVPSSHCPLLPCPCPSEAIEGNTIVVHYI